MTFIPFSRAVITDRDPTLNKNNKKEKRGSISLIVTLKHGFLNVTIVTYLLSVPPGTQGTGQSILISVCVPLFCDGSSVRFFWASSFPDYYFVVI